MLKQQEFISYARFLHAQDRRRRLAAESLERERMRLHHSNAGVAKELRGDPGPQDAAPRQ